MLKQLLLILTLTSLPSCTLFAEVQEGVYEFTPVNLNGVHRERVEREKKDFLILEDINIGSDSVAAWDRKVGVIVEAHYVHSTLVYRGNVLAYVRFIGGIGLDNNITGLMPLHQRGVLLGLNGIAIGGKRKIIIDPRLVCEHLGEQTNPNPTCRFNEDIYVRKEQLIVETTLTESCIPQAVVVPTIASGGHAKEVGCQRSDTPIRHSNDPIWRLY